MVLYAAIVLNYLKRVSFKSISAYNVYW